MKTGKSLICTKFQVKLKNRTQWERWTVELNAILGGIVGSTGIVLKYVIWKDDAPVLLANVEWEEMAIAAVPLQGNKYKQDRKLVHQIILRNIAEDSDAYTYLKPNIRMEDGRTDFKALFEIGRAHV